MIFVFNDQSVYIDKSASSMTKPFDHHWKTTNSQTEFAVAIEVTHVCRKIRFKICIRAR